MQILGQTKGRKQICFISVDCSTCFYPNVNLRLSLNSRPTETVDKNYVNENVRVIILAYTIWSRGFQLGDTSPWRDIFLKIMTKIG